MIENLKDDDAIGTHVKVWMKLNELITLTNDLEERVKKLEKFINSQHGVAEILLDIRDLLTPTRAMTKGEEQDYVDGLSEKPEQSV